MEVATRRIGLPGFINAWLRLMIIAVVTSAGMAERVSAQEQAVPPPSEQAEFSDAELEKLAQPIALYPDPLLAIMLPASAYPLEIIQAARFVEDPNNIPLLDDQPWDENVIALAHYPTVIQKMNDNLQWTVDLGNAFADQPADLMDAIQNLRAKAQAAGTLITTPQQVIIVTNAVVERYFESQVVYVTNTVVEIQPADPQIIYVPVYNPITVFNPSPGFVVAPTFSVGFRRGPSRNRVNWWYGGISVGGGGGGMIVWNGVGPWHPPFYPRPPGFRRPVYRTRPGFRGPIPGHRPPGWRTGGVKTLPGTVTQWQPNPNRRRSSRSGLARDSRQARGWNSPPNTWQQPGPGNMNNRPGTRASGNRPNTMGPVNNRPRGNPNRGNNRGAAGWANNQATQPNTWDNSAFSGMGNGNDARDFSNRGAGSRGGRGGGGRGGGGRSGGGRSGGGGGGGGGRSGGGRGGGGPRGGGG